MKTRTLVFAACAAAASAAGAQDGIPRTDYHVELVKRVQERLHRHGYDVGRIDGRLDRATQAALAQFQLSRNLPAGAQLDPRTLAELGVELAELEGERASAGATSPSPSRP